MSFIRRQDNDHEDFFRSFQQQVDTVESVNIFLRDPGGDDTSFGDLDTGEETLETIVQEEFGGDLSANLSENDAADPNDTSPHKSENIFQQRPARSQTDLKAQQVENEPETHNIVIQNSGENKEEDEAKENNILKRNPRNGRSNFRGDALRQLSGS
jgi:hypothetical protein